MGLPGDSESGENPLMPKAPSDMMQPARAGTKTHPSQIGDGRQPERTRAARTVTR